MGKKLSLSHMHMFCMQIHMCNGTVWPVLTVVLAYAILLLVYIKDIYMLFCENDYS